MPTLRDLIGDGRVHVLDGAMGTMLYSRGVFVNVSYDELNLSQPALVREVHEAYVQAGAEILETNTFGANPVKLSSHGLDEQTEAINRSAVAIARRAAGSRALVVGALGPLGIRLEPWGPTARSEAIAFFSRQARGLLEGEVDGFILETFIDINEVETIASRLSELGADVVGLNCSVGPAAMLDSIERMVERTDRPVSAQPNAGLPRAVDDRRIYLASPEYMGSYARRMIQAGARFVGGCCGTTPDHIRKIHAYVTSLQPRLVSADLTPGTQEPIGTTPAPLANRSGLGAKLATGEWVNTVEIAPPKGWNPAEMIEQCRTLQSAGVDAVNVLDSARAQSRMGVVPAALIIQRETGMEAVFHYTCRDRNMLGMLSDLLGAAAGGLRNVLIVTGDPPATGPYPDSTAVFDIDSIGLTNLLHRLNQGLDPGGNPIGEPTRYVVGVALNQGAEPRRELERFAWKVDAGADFAVTQPVFDPGQLEGFLKRARSSIPVIAGIWPLTSLRNAEFLANEVPGVVIPPAIIERMRKAQEHGAAAARAEGVAIASEMVEAVRDLVQGVQVSTPGGRTGTALDVLEALRSVNSKR
jgi:methionine synthase I (cobalamin-dependent)/5,10-methylenetetrahydrofolate reductase